MTCRQYVVARNLYVKGTRVRACTQHMLYHENYK